MLGGGHFKVFPDSFRMISLLILIPLLFQFVYSDCWKFCIYSYAASPCYKLDITKPDSLDSCVTRGFAPKDSATM
jgi:hypothetical protein